MSLYLCIAEIFSFFKPTIFKMLKFSYFHETLEHTLDPHEALIDALRRRPEYIPDVLQLQGFPVIHFQKFPVFGREF